MARSIAVTTAAAELQRIQRLTDALKPFGRPVPTAADIERAREIVNGYGLSAKDLRP